MKEYTSLYLGVLVNVCQAAGVGAQTIADSHTQVAVESAVLAYSRPDSGQYTGYALDARLYLAPGTYGFKGFHPRFGRDWVLTAATWSSAVRVGRDSSHVNALASLLGAAVLAPADDCAANLPTLCRLGSHRGLLAFSPVWILGDTAQVVFYVVKRGGVPFTQACQPACPTLPLDVSTGHYRLQRTKNDWRVVAHLVGMF
jgi:hypothetical protein